VDVSIAELPRGIVREGPDAHLRWVVMVAKVSEHEKTNGKTKGDRHG
jgi:hypothetical protein